MQSGDSRTPLLTCHTDRTISFSVPFELSHPLWLKKEAKGKLQQAGGQIKQRMSRSICLLLSYFLLDFFFPRKSTKCVSSAHLRIQIQKNGAEPPNRFLSQDGGLVEHVATLPLDWVTPVLVSHARRKEFQRCQCGRTFSPRRGRLSITRQTRSSLPTRLAAKHPVRSWVGVRLKKKKKRWIKPLNGDRQQTKNDLTV